MKKLPVTVLAAMIALLLSTAVLAAPAYQQTESVEENARHTVITVSGADAAVNGTAGDGHNIVTVDTGAGTDAGSGHNVVLVDSSEGKTDGEHTVVEVGDNAKKETDGKKPSHQIINVSGGDTVSVVGEPRDARAGYEDYSGGYYTLWDSDGDGYDDYYDYVNENIYDYSEDGIDYGSSIAAVSYTDDPSVYGAQGAGYYDYGYDDGYYDGGYSEGYYDDGYYSGGISRGFNGTVILIALGIGFIVALTYYASTKHSYENAGIGVVYDLRDNAVLKLAGDGVIDRQIDQRSSIDRGFYGRSGAISSSQQAGSLSAGDLSAGRPGGVQVHVGTGMPQRPGGTRPGAPNMSPRPGQPQRPGGQGMNRPKR